MAMGVLACLSFCFVPFAPSFAVFHAVYKQRMLRDSGSRKAICFFSLVRQVLGICFGLLYMWDAVLPASLHLVFSELTDSIIPILTIKRTELGGCLV